MNLMEYSTIQPWLFWACLVLSVLLFIKYLGEDRIKSVMCGIFPFIVYCFINFTVEAAIYGIEMFSVVESLNFTQRYQVNMVLGFCDMKVVTTIIAFILWIFVWKNEFDRKK